MPRGSYLTGRRLQNRPCSLGFYHRLHHEHTHRCPNCRIRQRHCRAHRRTNLAHHCAHQAPTVEARPEQNAIGTDEPQLDLSEKAPSPLSKDLLEDRAKLMKMGLNTALAIALHNFPEGLARPKSSSATAAPCSIGLRWC